MDPLYSKIVTSVEKLEAWVAAHGYKGYEPFDGLLSFIRPITFQNTFAERLLIQGIRQSPINLRPILGIQPQDSTKGRGYMAWGYLTLFKMTQNPKYKDKAAACLRWLIANTSEGYRHYCWGNHFDFSSRGGKQAKFVPTIVWSSLIGQVFLDGYELFGEKKYLDVAVDISDWILSLPRKQTQDGLCLAYTPEEESTVHNSNMLGAAMLARTAALIPIDGARRVAEQAMAFSCNRQLPSGAWYYGEEINTRWIDNFHTGYNLDSLKCYMDSTGDRAFQDNLFRGFRFFRDVFFESSGKPGYYHNRTYPVDIQCAAQAITTLANFSEYDSSCLPLATLVAGWTLDNMQDKSGFFYYRMLPWFKVKIPMFHWGQATMFRGLALLMSKLDAGGVY